MIRKPFAFSFLFLEVVQSCANSIFLKKEINYPSGVGIKIDWRRGAERKGWVRLERAWGTNQVEDLQSSMGARPLVPCRGSWHTAAAGSSIALHTQKKKSPGFSTQVWKRSCRDPGEGVVAFDGPGIALP